MIERTIFREENHIFRELVRRFIDREIVPFHAQWERDGIVPRELWLKAGAEGLLCCTVPEEYGGMGSRYLSDVRGLRYRGALRPAACVGARACSSTGRRSSSPMASSAISSCLRPRPTAAPAPRA